MSRKGQSITLSISERDKAELESLALELGMKWGDRPNISKLVEAISRRQLLIAPNHDWKEPRLQALKQALDALTDAGQIETALEVASLLLSRSELSIPLRREVERFIEKPAFPWRIALEHHILRQQPFQLTYQDAAEQIWHFHIYHAQIERHEDRQYLDCWCLETEGNFDLPELSHNRCLRLDRIPDAAIAPISGSWRETLDSIAVEMHLFQGLAFAYRSKTGADIANDWLEDIPQVRRVVRKVSNTFWFFREVLRYGEDCEIVAPDSVRDRFKQKLLSLCDRYHLNRNLEQ
ncbi:MAG: WYL domain-containing protein [Desertifilum sp.]|nr:WYL domain-containing protein [Desertifilum sp.]